MILNIINPEGTKSTFPANYSTAKESTTIRGNASSSVTSIDVEYGSLTFTSASSEVLLNGDGTFIFPNPAQFQDGFTLSSGVNTFTLIDNFNKRYTVNVILSSEVLNLPAPPDGVFVRRQRDAVEIVFSHADSDVSFYTIYASTTSGGGVEGYTQINLDPIDPVKFGNRTEVVEEIGKIKTDVELKTADPLFAEVLVNQKEGDTALSSTSLGELEIPEYANRLRVNSTLNNVYLRTEISFAHNREGTNLSTPRTVQDGRFTTLPASEPLYYIIGATKVIDGVEVESYYSSEVSGKPVNILNTTTSLPVVSRDDLTTDMIKSIYLAQPDISVQAGSVVRDIIIDPIISEMERARFLLDFSYRSSSFLGLLQIDDPLNEGRSIVVEDSQYKTALMSSLFLESETQLQTLIDNAFEKLAINFGVKRRLSTQASGEVEFFTKTPPTLSFSIPSGTRVSGMGVSFLTTTSASIPLADASKFFNPVTKKYSVRVPVVAESGGASGNLTSGKITTGAPLGLSVTNPSPTFGGDDVETNNELAVRALGSLDSVDGGTKGGYERISRSVAGVSDSFIVDASSEYMKRDEDKGGKVDVWVKGESLTTVSDVFAPSYNSKFGSKFIPVGGVGSYRFRSLEATVSTPIYEMINRTFTHTRFGLYNASEQKYFDLTGYTVEDYRTIRLDTTIAQNSYGLADIIVGDYRSDASSKLVLSRQPVRSIVSVLDESATAVTGYVFDNNNDPLLLGRSTKDTTSVTLSNSTGDKIKAVSEESHVISGFYEERLLKLGADPLSITVKSLENVSYYNPYSLNPDFTILDDGEGQVSIKRTSTSDITDGQTILISYNYLENITISYITNLVIKTAQDLLDKQKNLGADVVVKEIRKAPLNISASVFLTQGTSSSDVNDLLQYNLSNLIISNNVGGVLRPSEVVREINATEGVSHVSLPLVRMSFAEDTFIVREKVKVSLSEYREVTSLSNSSIRVWIIDTRILNTPQIGGGTGARVFKKNKSTEKETSLTLLNNLEKSTPSNWVKDTAFILGDSGLTGLSESSSKLLVGLEAGDDPSVYGFELDYVVSDKIEVITEARLNEFSSFSVGDLSFTFEEE
jgi:hypothetical protein